MLNTVRRPGMRGAGSGGLWGFINSHFWVDREFGLAVVLCCQALPMGDPGPWSLFQNVESAVYAGT